MNASNNIVVALVALLVAACGVHELTPPVIGDCNNAELTKYDALLIIAPHPDDEVLGFAGLASEYERQGKPVRTIVVTDGDAYCTACSLWTTGSTDGGTCDAPTLSNLETSAIDSLAEVRREESRTAATLLGLPAPEFLTYPDTGIAFARMNIEAGDPTRLLTRSDFSSCASCGDCAGGYGGGPETRLNANTLTSSLDSLIGATTANTLIATTHWLDSHPDHAALGSFVSERVAAASDRRTIAFSVIHANTNNGYASSECWYPGPAAADCGCVNEAGAQYDDDWIASLSSHRVRPGWPQVLPDDIDYGEPTQLCLGAVSRLAKPQAIDAFETQLGTVGREPDILPESRKGLLDCSGYLRAFGRRTEVFVVK